MKEEITVENLQLFRKNYEMDIQNKLQEKEITQKGIENVCKDVNYLLDSMPFFHIELPETQKYDQKESSRCWLFAGLNFIKYNIKDNLNGKEEQISCKP